MAQKDSNQDDYILLPGSGPESRFIAARVSVAGCLADWQMLGGAFAMRPQPAPPACPSAPGCRGVGNGGRESEQLCPQALRAGGWQVPVE